MPAIIAGVTKAVLDGGESGSNKKKDSQKSNTDSDFRSKESSHGSSSPDSEGDDEVNKPKKKRDQEPKAKGCTYRHYMACKPEQFRGDKTATDALRWIENIETTLDVSG
ncbi:hypothetical protein QVD17_41579 [Tagetes erecta]|uniref:Uncharacterized protein n=1 Tax=Tagetes erecta TaxID=13708 RepID=A0AAD8JPE0_TARER|nr:hypothetical protein QVD17_41579 [Tagetes erecta]